MAFVAVVVLAGLSRRHVLRRPFDAVRPVIVNTDQTSQTETQPPRSRLVHASVDVAGQIKLKSGESARGKRTKNIQSVSLGVKVGASY